MTSFSGPSAFLDRDLRRARVEADLAAMPGLREELEGLELWPDLEAEIARCVPPLMVSPVPSREVRRRFGVHFSPAEVGRFLRFSAGRCRHVKGRWGGLPIVPDLWQVLYVLGPVFGWRQADGERWHREVFLEVPRKNGKSTLAAVVGLYLLMCDSNLAAGRLFEPGAEVYSAATTTAQAQAVFGTAEAIAKGSPSLARRLGVRASRALVYEGTVSSFQVVSGDPAKAEEKMGGNPSAAIIDETHVHKSPALIETLETGTTARSQPLVVHLTTAGANPAGTIYGEKHEMAVAIAAGEVVGSRTWAVVYTVPAVLIEERWSDPEIWEAANPGYGVSVSPEYLAETAAKGQRSERKRRSFLRLHLGIQADDVSTWVDLDHFDAGAAHLGVTLGELAGEVGYAGLDLSSSVDLSALAVVVPRWVPDPEDPAFEVEALEVVLRCWTPAEGVAGRSPVERELFTRWIDEGWLTACNGSTIDYDDIEAAAFDLARRLELVRVGFDRWGSKSIANHLTNGGLAVAEIGQGFAGISPAMKETERLIGEHRLRTGGNPLLRWSFAGLAVQQDPAGNIKPHRPKSTARADPAVAVVMAVDGYARANYVESAYESSGLVVG